MKNFLLLSFFSLMYCCISCTQSPSAVKKSATTPEAVDQRISLVGKPVRDLDTIVKSFNNFWSYFNDYAQLYNDYPTFNEANKAIDKGQFLEAINTGKYLPMVLYGEKQQLNFRLTKIPQKAPENIRLILMNYANRELNYYKMEGKPIPDFSFKALDGKVYTSANTKGKIVLFKCWFISCVQCVAEMPALNEVVKQYEKRDDIVFISLAIDQKKELKQFLTKTKFDYATVANQKNYMEKKLHVQLYPTHFIIDKKGIMVKAVDDEREMEFFLTKELGK